jgi:Right handed beta helix region/Pel9A-like, right handed beta helix region
MHNMILVLILVSFFEPVAAHAATYYVSTSGSDSNPGTSTQPFLTIRKGASVLASGDTLNVNPGTYVESIDTNSVALASGTSGRLTTIQGINGTPTIRPSNGLPLNIIDKQYVLFSNLKLDAINAPNTSTSLGDGVSLYGASYITISDCEILNAPGNGVITHDSSSYLGDHNRFIRLKVHDNGYENDLRQRVAHGFYIITDFNVIEQCDVYNNYGYGVHIYNSGGGPDYNELRRSRVYGNGRGPYAVNASPGGIMLSQGTGNMAYNNLVWGNFKSGISVNYNGVNSAVYNNTVYKNGGYGIEIGSGAVATTVKNNIVYQNYSAIVDAGQSTAKSNNLTIDPKFVNESASDFRLQSGSPGIDAGSSVSVVPDDFEGTSRPKGSSYDIGAYEFQGSTTNTAPPVPTSLRFVSP